MGLGGLHHLTAVDDDAFGERRLLHRYAEQSRLKGGDMNVEVRNNPTEYRYEVWADGELAGYTQYGLGRGRIAFIHTKIYESYEGLGLGSRLARGTLDDARARGLMVMPYCPFIADFIERHLDEYRDLVAPGMLTGGRL